MTDRKADRHPPEMARVWTAWIVALTLSSGCGDGDGPTPDDGAFTGASGPPATTSGGDAETGTSSSESSSEAGSGDPDAPAPPECVAFCTANVSCGLGGQTSQESCEAGCSAQLDELEELADPACIPAYRTLMACIGGLACDALEIYWELHGNPEAPDYPCRTSDIEVLALCQ